MLQVLLLVWQTHLVELFSSSGFPCGACQVDGLMCSMHENTLSTLPGINNIEDCRAACNDEPQCAFLTYFAADRFFL